MEKRMSKDNKYILISIKLKSLILKLDFQLGMVSRKWWHTPVRREMQEELGCKATLVLSNEQL